MKIFVSQTKRQIKAGLTYLSALAKGYPFKYAREQNVGVAATYEQQWSEFITNIPHKPGADEVNRSRLWNLQRAAERIDGLILQPGEIFGFWNRVPKPTARNGFRAGPAFKRGKVTTEVGGGLCLISTNVFNAFLLAGCEILERHHHSMDPYGERRFFPLGRDAMVYYGYRDLMIRNQSAIPVQIRLSVLAEAGVVRCSVNGQLACPVSVKLEAEIAEIYAAQELGEIEGYRAVVRRRIAKSALKRDGDYTEDYVAWSSYEPCAAYFGTNQPVSA